MDVKTLMTMIIPLLAINLVVIAVALRAWFKYGVKNLNKWIWLIIILFVTTFGPIAFLIIGKGDETYDDQY